MTTTDVAVRSEAEQALMAAQDATIEAAGPVVFQTPILKVCQELTKEVKADLAEAGDFFNTLTTESYGTAIEFIVAFYQPGRAASLKDGRYFVSINEDLIPEAWEPVVGAEWVGQRFDEYPDAEEQFRKAVNAKEREWGGGPDISTTHNYTGLVIPPLLAEGDETEIPEPLPVRLSLMRTTKPAHDKIMTLKQSLLRNKPFWHIVFDLSTAVKTSGRHESYIVNVKKGRNTTAGEQQLAVDLAMAVHGGRVQGNDEASADAPVAAAPTGGIEV